MPFDMSSAIAALATEIITLEHPSSSGSYVNGVWQPSATTSTQISAQVTPAGPRDLLRLPEGEQTKEVISIFSSVALKTASLGQAADVVIWNGTRYQVSAVQNWSAYGYCQALATKVSEV